MTPDEALRRLQEAAFFRPDLLAQIRDVLIEQEFRPEPPTKKLLFARWLVQQGKISG